MRAAAIAAASIEAENAFRCLARMSLHLDAVGLEVEEDVAAVIEDVGDIATGLTQLADALGHGEVERRANGAHWPHLAKAKRASHIERRERCPT